METSFAYGLYVIIALGGVGVYLALPRSGRSLRTAGHVFSLAALAGLVVLLARTLAGDDGTAVYFLIFTGLALTASVRLITHPKPVYSALYFVLVVLSVVGLLVLQEAEFLAIAVLIIYAGAIMVTYLFVIMLAQQSAETEYDTRSRRPLGAVAAGFILIAAVTGQISELAGLGQQDRTIDTELVSYMAQNDADRETSAAVPPTAVPPVPQAVVPGNTDQIGRLLLTRYMLAMELAGVLLLVAMVGAIALARKHIPSEALPSDRRDALPPGQIGKTVEPF